MLFSRYAVARPPAAASLIAAACSGATPPVTKPDITLDSRVPKGARWRSRRVTDAARLQRFGE